MCFIRYFDKCSLIIINYGNVSQYAHIAIFYEINEILEEKLSAKFVPVFEEKYKSVIQ